MNICVKKKGDVFNNFYGEIARLNFPKKFKHEIRLQTGQLKSYHRKFLVMEEMSVRMFFLIYLAEIESPDFPPSKKCCGVVWQKLVLSLNTDFKFENFCKITCF